MRGLFKHQRVALSLLCSNNSLGLFMEQGTGKTLPTLCAILEKLKNGDANTVLIICPIAVIGSWQRDAEKFFSPEDQRIIKEKVQIINYDLVWRRKEYYERKWDILVCDESHYIKNRSSIRTKTVLRMSLKATYRYILTGTPIANGKIHEIYTQFAFLAPFTYGRGKQFIGCEWFGTWKQFTEKYCLLDRYYNPYKYFRVNEIQEIIDEHSYRILKEECSDLPDKLPPEDWEVQLAERKLYKELHEDGVASDYGLITRNPVAKLTKLRSVASGFINSDDGVTHPLKCNKPSLLTEFLEQHDKKLVIFAAFTHSVNEITLVLSKLKIPYLVLDGRTKDKTLWRRFQDDITIRVLVAKYQSANAGVDLYAANTMIFYEPPLSSVIYSQAQDRIHRQGQRSPCSYIRFVTKGTVERAIWKALDNYTDFSDKLFEEYMNTYQKSRY